MVLSVKVSNNQNKHIAYLTHINYIRRGTNLGHFPPTDKIIHLSRKVPKNITLFEKK